MALPLDACAFCFTADKPLRLCSRCRTLSFCSRECQTRAWMPNHKRVCDALIRLQDAGEDDEDGAPLVFVGETHAGVLCPGKKKPAGVPRNFGLLQRAESHCHGTDAEADEKCMRIGGLNYIPDEERLNSWKKECLGEVDSKLLFDDIINNDHEWTAFFMHSRNLRHLITAASLLHGMADIYMKRCSFEQCANVLDWTERVPGMIAKFSQQEIAYECNYYTSMDFQMHHYKELEFLNMTFRSELNIRAGEFNANVPKFREICLYEAGRSSTFAPNDDVYVAAGTFHLRRLQLSRKMPLNYIPTEKELLSLPPKAYVRCMRKFEKDLSPSDNFFKEHTALMKCSHCGKEESALGEFKACQRCHAVVYCGRDCQRGAWKGHKKTCGKEK